MTAAREVPSAGGLNQSLATSIAEALRTAYVHLQTIKIEIEDEDGEAVNRIQQRADEVLEYMLTLSAQGSA
jgi:hypothetical protein